MSSDKLKQMLAQMRAAKLNPPPLVVEKENSITIDESTVIKESEEEIQEVQTLLKEASEPEITDKYGNVITYNAKQQEFIDLATSGKSCILIGPAGTGKTTCMKGTTLSLIHSGRAGVLNAEDHKHLVSGTPGIVVCAYTRRAVANIRRNMSDDMKANCITIHKLLEYQPVYYEDTDPRTGDTKTKMVFEATRNDSHPLPSSIHTIIFEESSMIGTELYMEVIRACPHKPQLIFLGDIQQLPPVFGPAILGFKLLQLPVVELTEVYRQALESPIISLAHRILKNDPIYPDKFKEWNIPGKMKIHPWAKKISAETALDTIALFFCGNSHKSDRDPSKPVIPGAILSKVYDPEEDMILIPFNKAFGTDELNKHIAHFLARSRKEYTYEVIAGFNRYYFSPGEKVLYDKEDALIVKIERNPAYAGAVPLPESQTLDYWGYDPIRHAPKEDTTQEDVDFLLNQVAANDEDRVRQCSHIITIQMRDSETEIRLTKASEVNTLLLGYALTVHKSQGSEWRKVFFVTHQSHATMLQRELLYTAVTRAREELFVICEPELFVKGIESQRVKGDTLAEKAEFFKGKLEEGFVLDMED